MATDRELIEAAAKAAGYWSTEFNCPSSLPHPAWNPIESDADAFRLMVDLKIRAGRDDLRAYADWWSGLGLESVTELCASVPRAATRRAITRAAAHIGGLTDA